MSVIALGLVMFAPSEADAQGVSIYVGPGYPGNSYYPPNSGYGYYPNYGYSYYPGSYGYYGYRQPYYRPYWGQGRRVGRRAYRRWNRWD
ncbi:MAG: hypothetical protein ACREDO_07355 [Methyloceanibacter sp.]